MIRQCVLITSLLFTISLVEAKADNLTAYSSGEVYYLGLIKVYDATLFIDEQAESLDMLSPLVSKCLELDYNVSLQPEDFIRSAEKVLSRQLASQDLKRLEPYIDRIHSSYKPVEKGDRYRLCYEAGLERTELSLNDEKLAAVSSKEFSSAYFGIWLKPDNPLDESLQQELLSPAGKHAQEN